MNLKKLNDCEVYIVFVGIIVTSISIIIKSPYDSVFLRLSILSLISMTLFIFKKQEETRSLKFLFQFMIMILLMANKIKTVGDIIIGKNIYNLPELPYVSKESLLIFSFGLLLIIGCYISGGVWINSLSRENKKYKKDDVTPVFSVGREFVCPLMYFNAIAIGFSSFARPIFDACVTDHIDYMNLQKFIYYGLVDGLITVMPLFVLFISFLKDFQYSTYESGDFLITDNHTIVKYKGKKKRIYVPKNLNIFLTDTFIECDSTYEIWFEEGTTELPPLKFKKSIPDIHYPGSLQNIREYSVFINGQTPFDNAETVKALLKNPNFKIIDGCVVNTKTKTLLFVIDHSKNEFKIPDCVEKLGRFAFDDLNLGKYYKLQKNPNYDTEAFSELYKKHINFSNGTDKEYLLNAAETVIRRTQLEKIYLHKNIKFIDSEALELATGLREVYVPEDVDYDLAEMISTRPYIKYLGKGKKITHRMIERLLQIHAKIKSGCFPNSKQLAYDLETSEPTINRDIEYLRDSRGAPIEYDHVNRGYYYTEDYELFFDK